jgi:hypothetical protein
MSWPVGAVDLAWPAGLQEGYSQPVAFLTDTDEQVEAALNSAGYRYFTDLERFRAYVEREIVAAAS